MGALSDRIGDLEPKGKYENEDWATGFYAGTEEAAKLAAEADELMREMAEAITKYATARTVIEARQAQSGLLKAYEKIREQNK